MINREKGLERDDNQHHLGGKKRRENFDPWTNKI